MYNRTIKFRLCHIAQDGSKTIRYEDDGHLIGLNGTLYENYGSSWKNPMWESIFDGEAFLQQYAEVKDKNGKEIYEGDIVSHKGYIGKVSFFAGMFILDYPDQTDSGPIGFLQTLDMEIIGNVFENGELLK